MAVDGKLLQGEVSENPALPEGQADQLLLGFLKALADEQENEEAHG